MNRYPNKTVPFLRAILLYYRDPNFRVVVLIRCCVSKKKLYLKKWCCKKLQIKYNVLVSRNTKIGKNFRPEHYLGLVIGSGVIIGDNCVTYQQVTLGQKNDLYPQIGDNVTIYAGAKIIGDIKIGDNVIIGANAVVLKDIPNGCTAVGVPARVINNE